MAHLEVQRKSGISPIWWIVGLIILVALIWWVVAGRGTRDVADMPANAVAPAATPAIPGEPVATLTPVSDIGFILTAPDAAAIVNRPVVLQNVQVQAVVSDVGFWVGTSDSQRVFVALDEVRTPNTQTEGRYDVTAGQQLAVYGTVQPMPSDLTQGNTRWNLNSTDQSALAQQPLYIRADSLNIY